MQCGGRTYGDATVDSGDSAVAPQNTASSLVRTHKCLLCQREGIITLNCDLHKLCQKCLPKNIARFGADEDSIYKCPSDACTVPVASPPIWIYVDNSNIWIGAKYLASKVKGFQSSQDHRVRISIGNLTDVVSKSREVRQGTLYGSEPPKIDSVWEKIREHEHWVVKTKKKSFITHKEKEVDAQLLVDVTEVACTTPRHERSTIVLITGDADMCPAVEKIMEYEGWKVEIYMWKNRLSNRLKALSKKSADVICEPFDHHMMDVVFTNTKFPNTKVPNDSSAVLTINPGTFPKRVIDETWWNKLESIAQWPVQYMWIIRDGEETDDLLLVFSHLGERKKYNVSNFVQKINDCEAADEPILPNVQRAETYIDYKKRRRNYEAVMKCGDFRIDALDSTSNFLLQKSTDLRHGRVYERPVFERHIHVVDFNPTSPNTSSGDVKFKSVPPTRVGGQYIKKCRLGKNCIRGSDCEFQHSNSDKIYFEGNGGKGNPLRKTRTCKRYPSCPIKDASRCNYAHGVGDSWCLNCRRSGHFTTACPSPVKYTMS